MLVRFRHRDDLHSPAPTEIACEPELRAYQHRFHYALAGVLLSTGAPLGLLFLRAVLLSLRSVSSIQREIATNCPIYLYSLVATMVAFAAFGYVLGRQTDKLQQLSVTDALTGLYNRRALNARLDEEYSRSWRYRSPLSLLLVDVDELKHVNDMQGHAIGDQVIRDIANAIKVALRGTDVGGRWGGDEFLIIAPSTAGAAARTLAERLRLRLAKQATVGDAAATVSVGVATFDPTDRRPEGPERLMQAADDALHIAKAAGRNQVRVA